MPAGESVCCCEEEGESVLRGRGRECAARKRERVCAAEEEEEEEEEQRVCAAEEAAYAALLSLVLGYMLRAFLQFDNFQFLGEFGSTDTRFTDWY